MKCPACASEVPGDDAARCPRCDASLRTQVCPHCRGTAGASPDAELRYKCDICGGPRVPALDATPRSGRENESLRKAHAELRARAVARGLGAIASIAGGGLFLVTMMFTLVLGVHLPILVGGLLVTGIAALLASSAFGNARSHGRAIAPELEAAWQAAVNDLAKAHAGAISTAQVVAALGIDEARAEELLAIADVSAVEVGRPPVRFEPAPDPAAENAESLAVEEAAAAERQALETSKPRA